jgi:hypothetical protein
VAKPVITILTRSGSRRFRCSSSIRPSGASSDRSAPGRIRALAFSGLRAHFRRLRRPLLFIQDLGASLPDGGSSSAMRICAPSMGADCFSHFPGPPFEPATFPLFPAASCL